MVAEQGVAPEGPTLTRATLKTPRAAAIAGIVFSLLFIVILWLIRTSVPADPLEPGAWLQSNARRVSFAVNLVPFAGIAFLWFLGVLRDRLGVAEDRFFATVFFGSGLLFLAMLFISAAVIGAIIVAFSVLPEELLHSATFPLARAIAYTIMNVYSVKMAGVFMFTASTITISTKIAPRWIAILGYVLAFVLVLGSSYISWCLFALPIWVLAMSVTILRDQIGRSKQAGEDNPQ
jgi:hypothetical protein